MGLNGKESCGLVWEGKNTQMRGGVRKDSMKKGVGGLGGKVNEDGKNIYNNNMETGNSIFQKRVEVLQEGEVAAKSHHVERVGGVEKPSSMWLPKELGTINGYLDFSTEKGHINANSFLNVSLLSLKEKASQGKAKQSKKVQGRGTQSWKHRARAGQNLSLVMEECMGAEGKRKNEEE